MRRPWPVCRETSHRRRHQDHRIDRRRREHERQRRVAPWRSPRQAVAEQPGATGTARTHSPQVPPLTQRQIATPVRRGSQRASWSGETYVAIKPRSPTPKRQEGQRWTIKHRRTPWQRQVGPPHHESLRTEPANRANQSGPQEELYRPGNSRAGPRGNRHGFILPAVLLPPVATGRSRRCRSPSGTMSVIRWLWSPPITSLGRGRGPWIVASADRGRT